MTKAGISNIDFEDKYVAIKMHFGEPGNLAFLRPNWAKCVADKVKELGGKPFLTDCNTLYVGGRKNALDHMLTAEQNGFNYVSTGCQIIIGDGLKGSDDIEIPQSTIKSIQNKSISIDKIATSSTNSKSISNNPSKVNFLQIVKSPNKEKSTKNNQIYTNLTKQLDKVQLIIAIKDTEIEEYTKIQKKLSFLMKIYSKECLNLFQKQLQYKTIT